MHKAIFFDRDGVLNIDKGYVNKISEFEWIEGAKEAILFLKKAGFIVVVVTNQGGIARGFYSEEDVKLLHHWMQKDLEQNTGVKLDHFYYCPHFKDGKIAKYSMECNCRKPAPGMLEQAIEDFQIDKNQSWMIGDKKTDLLAAERAGIKGVLFTGGNLFSLIKTILNEKF